MTTFNLVLDTNAAMLLQLAGAGVSRSTAFEVLDRINTLEMIDVGRTIDTQPSVAVEVFSCGYVAVGPSDRDFPLVEMIWDGNRYNRDHDYV